MADDPFTLVVTLDKKGEAAGELYFDDATSFNYVKRNEYVHRQFTYKQNMLFSTNKDAKGNFQTKSWLERVIVYGLTTEPKTVKIEYDGNQSAQLQFTYDANSKVVLIRKPGVNINKDWSIIIN